jgi:hypothetical protein
VQDNSDDQYAGFRDNIPYLTILVVLHPLFRRIYERVRPTQSIPSSQDVNAKGQGVSAQTKLASRLTFDFYSSIVFIAALNGFSALKVLLILYINFKIGTALPRHAIPAPTWVFNIAVLFANELTQGYRWSALGKAFVPFYPPVTELGNFLDSYGGIMPRWEVLFKITILRMISFNMDHYWSLSRSRAGSPLEVSQQVR